MISAIGGVAIVLFGCGSTDSPAIADSRSKEIGIPPAIRRTLVIEQPRRGWKIRSVGWRGKPHPGERDLDLLISFSWCAARSEPGVQRVEIVERSNATILTAFASFPPRRSLKAHDEPRHDISCPQVLSIVATKVALKRSATAQALYDGSTSPPSKRWPK